MSNKKQSTVLPFDIDLVLSDVFIAVFMLMIIIVCFVSMIVVTGREFKHQRDPHNHREPEEGFPVR